MALIDPNEIETALEKCKKREQELVTELNAIRSHIKGLSAMKIETYTYEKPSADDPNVMVPVTVENRAIDEHTNEPISDERRQELYDKIIPAVQIL